MDFLGSSSLNRCKKTSLVGVHHHSYTVPRHLPVLCSFIRHIDKERTRTQPLPLGRQSPASQKEWAFYYALSKESHCLGRHLWEGWFCL